MLTSGVRAQVLEPSRVDIEISSPQFVFRSARAILFRLIVGDKPVLKTMAGRSFELSELEQTKVRLRTFRFELKDGVIPAVAIDVPGPFVAILNELHVLRVQDRREFAIPGISLDHELTSTKRRCGEVPGPHDE